jgi:hypothetical protein
VLRTLGCDGVQAIYRLPFHLVLLTLVKELFGLSSTKSGKRQLEVAVGTTVFCSPTHFTRMLPASSRTPK